MRLFASSAEACPSTDSAPESGNRIAMIIRIVVVFPAPFGPMKPYNAPRGMARSRLVTALTAPNVLHTLLSRMASGIAVESTAPEVREARYVQARHSRIHRCCRRSRVVIAARGRPGDAQRRL